MESDHEKYIHDIDKVIKRLDFLGNNWENDLDDIQDRIMKGRWWDGLIELLNGSVEMKRLLIISRKIVNTKEEVTSRIEEKLDDLVSFETVCPLLATFCTFLSVIDKFIDHAN